MTLPRISIITPCFNRARFIREAVESVLSQRYANFEHVVVDGGSTDGTLQILREYSHLRLISEPDEGMYDAINKGLRLAQGEIIGLLNSDDLYPPDSFALVAEAFSKNPEAEAVVGGAEVFLDERGQRKIVRSNTTIQPEEFWFRLVEGSPVSNAWFFRRRVFESVGYFNPSYRYVADREFLIRVGLAGVRPVPISHVLYLYRSHRDSATLSDADLRLRERGLFRIKILLEGIRMFESFLENREIPPNVREHLRCAHGEKCYKLAATALYHRCFRHAAQALRHGFHYNPFWPAVFIRLALRRLWHGFANSTQE